MAVTVQTMLDNVEAAINARLAGGAVSAYTIGGRNIQYCSLKELYDIRDLLRKELNSSASGSTVNYASFKDPL